ncbi:hypothetical protein [Streptomyces phaeoluteigriseus]
MDPTVAAALIGVLATVIAATAAFLAGRRRLEAPLMRFAASTSATRMPPS